MFSLCPLKILQFQFFLPYLLQWFLSISGREKCSCLLSYKYLLFALWQNLILFFFFIDLCALHKEISLMRSQSRTQPWMYRKEFRRQFNSMFTLKSNSCRFTCKCLELSNHGFFKGFPVIGIYFLLISGPCSFWLPHNIIVLSYLGAHLITLYSWNTTYKIENQLYIKYIGAIEDICFELYWCTTFSIIFFCIINYN